MDRFTISLEETLATAFDELIAQRGYRNRSEAVRDILRMHLQQDRLREDADAWCVASLSFVYNHHEHDLSERLMDLQHAHHELTVSNTHAHLDHEQCIDMLLLKGQVRRVRSLAEKIIAERGVRHGMLNLILADHVPSHTHDGSKHQHLRPRL